MVFRLEADAIKKNGGTDFIKGRTAARRWVGINISTVARGSEKGVLLLVDVHSGSRDYRKARGAR
jgi:hypothetical protein